MKLDFHTRLARAKEAIARGDFGNATIEELFTSQQDKPIQIAIRDISGRVSLLDLFEDGALKPSA